MIEWHKQVCEKYDYTCQVCFRKFPKEMVTGHHIHTQKSSPHLKYDINNGILLCLADHNKVHNGEITIDN